MFCNVHVVKAEFNLQRGWMYPLIQKTRYIWTFQNLINSQFRLSKEQHIFLLYPHSCRKDTSNLTTVFISWCMWNIKGSCAKQNGFQKPFDKYVFDMWLWKDVYNYVLNELWWMHFVVCKIPSIFWEEVSVFSAGQFCGFFVVR